MRPVPLAVLTAVLVVLPATAALAHPSFDPNTVPVGEPTDTVLVVPHGCSTGAGVMPEEGEAVPTTRFDLQTPQGVTIEPRDVDGWAVEDDGDAIVWTDDGGATSDPIEFPVVLTIDDGAAGDQLALSAYQECEDGSSYRWTTGSDDTPPVRLELTEGPAGTGATDDGPDNTGSTTSTESTTETDSQGATEADTPEAPASPVAEEAAPTDAGDGGTIAVVAAVLVVLVGGGAFLFTRSRRSA